jgi:hypothetical protein
MKKSVKKMSCAYRHWQMITSHWVVGELLMMKVAVSVLEG